MPAPIPFPADPAQEIRIPVEELRPVIEKILVKNSMFQFDAKVVAERMLEADLYGVPSHGVSQLARYIRAMDMGDIDPRGRVLTLTDAACFTVFDGSRTVGALAASKGAEAVIAKAQEQGVGVAAIGDSQTLGAAEVYVRLIAKSGLIGICMSSTGGATVAAPGTRKGAVGNCALAYAVPVRDRHPIVFDTACGQESWGKLRHLSRYGIKLPSDFMFNEYGQFTGDLCQAVCMIPSGGALGFGLSMLCSILAGPLCGGWMPIRKQRRVDAEDSQHFFLALDPSKFCNVDKFQDELTNTIDQIRALPPEDPDTPVRIPGDRGAAWYEDAMANGVPLHSTVVEEIRELAEKKKIPLTW
jgi:LDH2 family malate/lactate/ureidoglycolate dehydrogenase